MRRRPNSTQWYNGRTLPWLLILAAYTLLGLLFTSQVWIDYAHARHPLTWWRAAAVALADWYLWALLTPLVVRLARRFRFDRRRWPGSLMVHIPASLVCSAGKQFADTFGAMTITGVARAPTSFMKLHVSFLTYWAIVGITYAVEHYQKYRERELQAARLQAALARAQVQSLQMQLHPHFLFNTLNAIAALMRENLEAADVMIARLGDLLRETLASADVPEVPLRRELELTDMYLDIQRARMGDRLRTRVAVEPQTLDVYVPHCSCSRSSKTPSATARRRGLVRCQSNCAHVATAPPDDRRRGRRARTAGHHHARPRHREHPLAARRRVRLGGRTRRRPGGRVGGPFRA
jgi:hypothetical protein